MPRRTSIDAVKSAWLALRNILLSSLLSLALSSLAFAQTINVLPYDHFDPVTLNEYAMAMLKAGDRTTALILLQRAVRLAPFDSRIAANLKVLQQGIAEATPFGRAELPIKSETNVPLLSQRPSAPWKGP